MEEKGFKTAENIENIKGVSPLVMLVQSVVELGSCATNVLDDLGVWCMFNLDGILKQAMIKLSAMFRSSLVEAKGKFAKIAIEAIMDSSVAMRSQQLLFQQ